MCHHRILHYPPLKDFENEISIGAHVDYGFLTILATDMVGGLQVLNSKKNVWVHVPPIENSFIINFGDMLARWTNNLIKATVHRVVNVSGQERYSSPFFLRPSLSTVLNPKVHGGEDEEVTCKQVLEGYYKTANLLKK